MATSRLASMLLFLVLASSGGTQEARAQAVGGTGQLAGRFVLRVQRCGRERGPVSLLVVQAADGSWSAETEVGRFTGTSAPLGTSGRRFDLSFDEASAGILLALFQSDATELCRGPVTATSLVKKMFTLKLNARRTRARFGFRYLVGGTTGATTVGAKYKLDAHGRWRAG